MQNRLSGVDNGIGLAGDPCAKKTPIVSIFWNIIWNKAAFLLVEIVPILN